MSDRPLENSLKVHRAMKDLTEVELAGLAGITRAGTLAFKHPEVGIETWQSLVTAGTESALSPSC